MLIHSVYFWLKNDVTDRKKDAFVDGLKSLAGISTVDRLHIGTAASTEQRPVVDNSFDYALIIELADPAAQEIYQGDPIHLQFAEDFKDLWTKVLVH
ncbi:MAG: Dabb family protein, partial [Planctomycetota bacterium]